MLKRFPIASSLIKSFPETILFFGDFENLPEVRRVHVCRQPVSASVHGDSVLACRQKRVDRICHPQAVFRCKSLHTRTFLIFPAHEQLGGETKGDVRGRTGKKRKALVPPSGAEFEQTVGPHSPQNTPTDAHKRRKAALPVIGGNRAQEELPSQHRLCMSVSGREAWQLRCSFWEEHLFRTMS